MLKLKATLFSFVLFLFLATLLAIPSYAQENSSGNFDATVSPVFFDFTAKPGATVNGRVRLRNNANSTLPIKIEIKKLGGDNNGDLTIQNAPDDTSSWFEIKNTGITAPVNEWVTIPFSIKVPDTAAYGYYWALSFTHDSTAPQTTGAKVNAAIVVPVLLNVSKEGAKTEGKIEKFAPDSSWYEYLPTNLTTTFANTGNVHIRPRGNIFIKDFFGRTVATLDANPNQGAVLPGTKKSFVNTWKDSFMWYEDKVENGKTVLDKNGKPSRELKIRFDKILDLRIGRYTATALMVVSDGTRDIAYERSTTFFVFPWKVVLGAIVFVLFAFVGLYSTTRSVGRKVVGLLRKK
jgi:hypothetical protein